MSKKSTILSFKFKAMGRRFVRFFKLLPIRLWRFGYHIFRGFTFQMSRKEYWKDEALKRSRASVILLWLAEFFVLFLEILGVGELYETVTDFAKSKTRPLQDWEIKMAKTVYGNSIDYQLVRIDETAWAGPKQYHFCYVSFNLINCWKRMANHILIHELMHIWQYQKMGAIYMIRALIAQHTHMGYNYGGVEAIQKKLTNKERLLDFNFEQQADVVADYFLLQQGYAPQWGKASLNEIYTYQKILEGLEEEKVA